MIVHWEQGEGGEYLIVNCEQGEVGDWSLLLTTFNSVKLHLTLGNDWACCGCTSGTYQVPNPDCALGACIWEVGDCMIVHWEHGRLVTA